MVSGPNNQPTIDTGFSKRAFYILSAGLIFSLIMAGFMFAMRPGPLSIVFSIINYPAFWFSEKWINGELGFLSPDLLSGDMAGLFVAPLVGVFIQWIGIAILAVAVDAARAFKLKALFWFLVVIAMALASFIVYGFFS